MQAKFKAVVLANEMNLNKVAEHFGINRKFTWEEPLRLHDKLLQGIVSDPNNKMVYLFHFGSAIFVNLPHHEIMDVVNYLAKNQPDLQNSIPFTYTDDYEIQIAAGQPVTVTNDCMLVEQTDEYQIEIVATILAKSVALEKIEKEIDLLFDEIEGVVNKLRLGKLVTSDKNLAKLSGKILGFKLNSISYIMLLDKPEITWTNEQACELFDQLSVQFDLDDRYKIISHKSETLMDITEVFSGLAHARRGNQLEWAIIILIAIEILLSLADKILK